MSAHPGAPGGGHGDPPANRSPNAKDQRDAASLRVLCVEDELVLRRTLLRLLEVLGHEPLGVDSAEDGLALLDARAVDVVITDLRLPAMDGEELAAEIERRHPSLRGRVILMSGFFHETKGRLNFLQKPFSAGQLSAALSQAAGPPLPPPPR